MRIQRVSYQLEAGGPMLWGAAIVTDFDGKPKYVIGEHDGARVYEKWYSAELFSGPLAYMDTVPMKTGTISKA